MTRSKSTKQIFGNSAKKLFVLKLLFDPHALHLIKPIGKLPTVMLGPTNRKWKYRIVIDYAV